MRRSHVVLLLAVVVGAVTGAAVAGIHALIVDVAWDRFAGRDAWWVIILPVAGLVLASAILRLGRDRSSATTEEYVRVFHDRLGHMRARSVPWRLAASIATIGLGGSMGLEGPSMYAGAAIGDVLERRSRRWLSGQDGKLLLVAGAAAGIAAIFKAPVTGIVFALEVPYRDDLARRALIPAMIASVSSYVVFVSLAGTTPLFPIASSPLRIADLLGSLAVGLACGIAARAFVALFDLATRAASLLPRWTRPLAGGAVTAGMGAIALATFHAPFVLGPGYGAIARAARGELGLSMLAILLVTKMVATAATAAGEGVGGLFFPSVLMGATLGGMLGHLVPGPPSLSAVVGIAAFLGGVYKVPLAGVTFVAEATGAPGYVIPGVLAAAVAYVASGRSSLSHRQRSRRVIDIDVRLDVSVAEIMDREWIEAAPSATLRRLADEIAVRAKRRVVPVAEAGRYHAMVPLAALADVPADRWHEARVQDIASDDYPVLGPGDRARDALEAMRSAGTEVAPVVRDGIIVGIVSVSDILRAEQILDALDAPES